MSFELICESCGAASGPSVGICPFCKSLLVPEASKQVSPALKSLKTLFSEGRMEEASLLAREALKSKEDISENVEVLSVCSQILFEVEAPSSQIKSILAKASLIDPDHKGIQELMNLVHAKSAISNGNPEEGKKMLESVLKSNPANPHALFHLASYVNSKENNPVLAAVYLEKALKARPNFLRAWACLASVSARMDKTHMAERALLKAISLEKNQNMKDFFNKLLLEVRRNSRKAA
ncbi:MAG: tetratricopeptide repeat protein [Pseudomonadota bacterium]